MIPDTGKAGVLVDCCWVQWECQFVEREASVLMARIADAEAAATRLAVDQARDMQAVRDLRRAEQAAALAGASRSVAAQAAAFDEEGWVASEIGMSIGLSESQVRRRLDWADALDRYPRVNGLAEAGGAPVWTLQRLVEHLDELGALVSPHRLAEVEAQTVAWLWAGRRTVEQLNRRMRRLILRAQADAGLTDEDAVARRHADRDVRVRSNGDGTANLSAMLPEADALAVAAALKGIGQDASDPRTVAQRRADVLVASIVGVPALYGSLGDLRDGGAWVATVPARIDVTIPVRTLTGAANAPGEVAGYGLVPGVTARDLADSPGATFRGLLFDADSGHLVGLAPDLGRVHWTYQSRPGAGYGHPPVMEALVKARDRHCRAPGCQRPAARCDCDHVTPWPVGQTSLDNTCCLCRYHHRLKTHATGWLVVADDHDDGLEWTTPTGHTAATAPYDYRNDDPPEF